jgi:hypothetical protein
MEGKSNRALCPCLQVKWSDQFEHSCNGKLTHRNKVRDLFLVIRLLEYFILWKARAIELSALNCALRWNDKVDHSCSGKLTHGGNKVRDLFLVIFHFTESESKSNWTYCPCPQVKWSDTVEHFTLVKWHMGTRSEMFSQSTDFTESKSLNWYKQILKGFEYLGIHQSHASPSQLVIFWYCSAKLCGKSSTSLMSVPLTL